MSRCFPYPLPGCSLSRDNKVSLIESIKKGKEKAKSERKKERKREKKDRKGEGVVHTNEVDGLGHGEKRKLIDEKAQKLEKWTASFNGGYIQSHGEDESSDVTEEHEQPVCLPKPSYSSESSQNSNKRRRHESPLNTIHANGSILKIRLSSQKRKETDGEEAGPSTSGRTDNIEQYSSGICHTRSQEEQPCSTSTATVACVPGRAPIDKQPFVDAGIFGREGAVSKSLTGKISRVALLYKDLVEGWVPPALGSEQEDSNEEDWLFQSKNQSRERIEVSSGISCSVGSNLWPRAQFLPTVDIYALPFAVPF